MNSEISRSKDDLIRAAEYVRMSTENQHYSIDNQSEAICLYCKEHHMKVVRTYTDAGKSGLTAHSRPGLRQLIDDVESGSADYSVIVVYDVSRWGRFQDVDESAYYEHRCRRANVAVHYCAEAFSNDGTPFASLLKAVKRSMAAEYSRELSVKSFAGKVRLIKLGFRQGGFAGYGLRRLLVDQQGQPRCVLQSGERKSIATDRVILIPGPPDEIAIVREVFRLYVVDRLSPAEIAKVLNDRSIPWQDERCWTRSIISNIVSNPKYIGTNVSNRHSGKLRHRRIRNPQEMWIQRENAFEGIVDPALFRQAEALTASRNHFYSDEQLLQHLSEFAKKYGTLTERQISADPTMPCSEVYHARFGGLLEAYKLIGYQPKRDYSYVARDRKLLPMRKNLVAAISAVIIKAGSSVRQDARTKLLVINQKCKLRVSVARCRSIGQSQRWLLRLHSPLNPHLTVIARLAPGDSVVRDYYVFPKGTQTLTQLTVAPFNSVAVDRYRFKDLSFLVDLCKLDPSAVPTVGESEQEVCRPQNLKIRPRLSWLSGARTSS